MKLVYTRHYNIGFLGLERLHPFDSRKYGRAWSAIGRGVKRLRNNAWVGVPRPASLEDLATVHDPAYLKSLDDPKVLAGALELPFLQRLPAWATWRVVLRPMRWAVEGSLIAAREALTSGVSLNLSGGYHHAKPSGGEGFCVFNDVAYLVHKLRNEGRLTSEDRIAYIDLDAHQGNGVCHHFHADRRMFIYDTFNPRIYPAFDQDARERVDCALPLPANCTGAEYLRLLELTLHGFIDSIGRSGRVGLAVYNAGTDVFAGDALGCLHLTASDVLARDLYVIDQLHKRGIPVVMLLSGGYSRESYKLVANTAIELLRLYGSS